MPFMSFNLTASTTKQRIQVPGQITQFILTTDGATSVVFSIGNPVNLGHASVPTSASVEILNSGGDYFEIIVSALTSACRVWVVYQ